MLPWKKRPPEVRNLFNPAFCTLLLRDAMVAYEKEKQEGMPYLLSFLILPLVLHKSTREALPKSIATKQQVWLQNNPEVRVDFARQARDLAPYVRESIMFGMHANIIGIDEQGNLITLKKKLSRGNWPKEAEPAVCRKKAQFLGRWMARTGDISTIFVMWGIRP
jgi:hypothetical protein